MASLFIARLKRTRRLWLHRKLPKIGDTFLSLQTLKDSRTKNYSVSLFIYSLRSRRNLTRFRPCIIYGEFIFLPSGCTTASLFILITGYASSPALAVAFLTIGVGITGLNASGYAVNILDIAPQYAGVIMGVTNVFGASPGFISPQIVGIVTPNKVIRKLFIFNNYSPKDKLILLNNPRDEVEGIIQQY